MKRYLEKRDVRNLDNEYLLEMNDIKKTYYGNQVLKGVHLRIRPGEIHSLVGENGAGKSTLMNILFGMDVIHSTGGYEGQVKFNGEIMKAHSPKEAMTYGIGMVHQEFMLIPGYTVTENIKLNREITSPNILSHIFGRRLDVTEIKKMGQDAKEALKVVNMNIDEWAEVAGLPVGHKQFIEIAREIDKKNIRLLVFDEPTAVLTESEAVNLLDTMKRLAKKGIAILFISHRLEEVMDVSDDITILRDGELVASKKVNETSIEELAELMVGRKVETTKKDNRLNKEDEQIILELRNFKVDMPGEKVKGIDLQVKKGEILGIGGLAGQGKIGIANGIMNLFYNQGDIYLYGQKLDKRSTKDMLQKKVAFVSEDRKGIGLVLDESIEMNIVFTSLQLSPQFLFDLGLFKLQNGYAIRQHAKAMVHDLDIRCTDTKQPVGSLSGGNQQKVCIARALTLDPDILLVSEPTRGIDIGAKSLVLDLLVKLNKEKNTTIIITSSELGELRSIADRIAIVSEGRIAGILKPDSSAKEFGLLMASRMSTKVALG